MTIERRCLDAETVAAWLDGGLDAPAVAAAEAHASTCERCQALLATVAKTMPVQARPEPAGARLWKWWLAPLAATAAAVTIWMVVPQTPMQPPAALAPVSDATAPPGTPTPAPARDALAAQPPMAPAAPSSFADAQPSAPGSANETKAVAADQQQDTRLAAAGARADQQAEPAQRAETAAAETRLAAEAPAERLREPAPAAPPAAAVAQLKIAPLEIVSPDANSRWRVAPPGVIERSEDVGRTWIPVRAVASEAVTAGASPAPLVCWLVGRNGLVLLATDGTNFTRLPFAETVDLVSVTSPEPRIADVTAADGRTFRTEDSGRTWRNR